jgi:hypothetical protein
LKDKPLVTGLAYAKRPQLLKALRGRECLGGADLVRPMLPMGARRIASDGFRFIGADRVERHLEGNLRHWKKGITAAFLEGLTSLLSANKRKALGYLSTEYQVAVLYLFGSRLEIPYYG